MKVIIIESGNIESLSIIDPKTGCCCVKDLILNNECYSDFVHDEERDVWSCDQKTFEWWSEHTRATEQANQLVRVMREEFGTEAIDRVVGEACEGLGFNDLPHAIIEALGNFEDAQDETGIHAESSNEIAKCINMLKAGWMKAIAAQLSDLHAKHGYPDVSPGPTIDTQQLTRRNYDEANEVDIEWFDRFYSDVEALQTCADVRCIGGGLAVTSFNTTAAFTAYKEAASKLISDWLSNKAWDDFCKAH